MQSSSIQSAWGTNHLKTKMAARLNPTPFLLPLLEHR
jgi:hypothetical protein